MHDFQLHLTNVFWKYVTIVNATNLSWGEKSNIKSVINSNVYFFHLTEVPILKYESFYIDNLCISVPFI